MREGRQLHRRVSGHSLDPAHELIHACSRAVPCPPFHPQVLCSADPSVLQGCGQSLQGEDHREGHRFPNMRVSQQVGGELMRHSPSRFDSCAIFMVFESDHCWAIMPIGAITWLAGMQRGGTLFAGRRGLHRVERGRRREDVRLLKHIRPVSPSPLRIAQHMCQAAILHGALPDLWHAY